MGAFETQREPPFYVLVGTFNSSSLHLLAFDPSNSKQTLTEVQRFQAQGNHSWLALDGPRDRVYATSWTKDDKEPEVVAYQLKRPGQEGSGWELEVLGRQKIESRSGYTALGPQISAEESPRVLYTVGGPSGEVFLLDQQTGGFAEASQSTIQGLDGSAARWQEMDYLKGGRVSQPGKTLKDTDFTGDEKLDSGSTDQQHTGVLAFGGLRHGSHSIDVGPPDDLTGEYRPVYVADIGRNCTFLYTTPVSGPKAGSLTLQGQQPAPEAGDGPRHAWPHPNGRFVYVVNEHSNIVEAYGVRWTARADTSSTDHPILKLEHVQSLPLLPSDESPKDYWADEVRLSPGTNPTFLFASTRGLEEGKTRGWVCTWRLNPSTGLAIAQDESKTIQPTHRYRTPTSGGWANAIEPCPWFVSSSSKEGQGDVYACLTDSEQGRVSILQLHPEGSTDSEADDGRLEEVGCVELGTFSDEEEQSTSNGTKKQKVTKEEVRGAATAVWLW